MKKEDLRIGNLVRYNNYTIVIQEIENEYVYSEDLTEYYYDDLTPIPITEGIALNMFGFTKDLNNDICKDINEFVFLHYYDGKVVLLDEERNNTLLTMHYVHEVQNLWWSFTREELIKTK